MLFDYSFNGATVYLYDLTANEEIESKVTNRRLGFRENDDDTITISVNLFVDCSNMVPYDAYYLKAVNIRLNGEGIDNIYYVFVFVSEGGIGFW